MQYLYKGYALVAGKAPVICKKDRPQLDIIVTSQNVNEIMSIIDNL